MPRAARSFADDLRARSDNDLAGLLMRRPDLARPAPTDLTSLAARAQTRASVQRALDQLNAQQLHLLEALLVAGADGAPTALHATKKAVEVGIRDLWERALVWRSSDGWRPARAVGEILTRPAGLGPTARELAVRESQLALNVTSTSAAREEAESQLSERARTVVNQLRWESPRASFSSPALRAVREELVDAGLMARLEGDEAVIPREVGIALRDGRLFATAWEEPALEVNTQNINRVDETAAASVLDLLWRFDDVAAVWDENPPRVLRTGGVSVRDHRALAAAIDSSSKLTAFILETGYAAGIFAPDGEIDPTWRPTDLYDEWASWAPARRWALLAQAWVEMTRAPSLAGEAVDGTLVNVLSRDAHWPMMRRRRIDVLDILKELPPGSAPSLHDVEATLRWQRPLRLPSDAPTRADVVLREAEWLGVTGVGALCSAARALLDTSSASPSPTRGDQLGPAGTLMAASMPEPVSALMIQGDLTAIAPGPLTEDVASFMRAGSVVESRGGATVFRFTEGSLRRLLDGGYTAAEVLDKLQGFSLTPIPQALEYLIHDVARRHGHLRVGSVSSYVRADDEHALDALMADTSLGALQLRRIAPTVAVCPLPAPTLLEKLREARHAPVAETSDGGVVVRTRTAPRSPTPRRSTPPVRVNQLDIDEATALATSMREGEKNAVRPAAHDAQERIPSTDPTVTLTMLEEAAAEHIPVWIGYVDSTGDIKRTLFYPERIDGGRVSGRLGDSSHTIALSIHRITGAAQA